MKFLNLLKKELRELINAQMIAGLVITVALLLSVGNIMSNVMDKASSQGGEINISDQDKTDYTSELIEELKKSGFTVNLHDQNNTDKAELLSQIKQDSLIIFPEGFTEKIIQDGTCGSIELINRMKTTSAIASLENHSQEAISFIEEYTKNYIMAQNGMSADDISLVESPVFVNEITVVSDKWEEISSDVLTGFISSQGTIIPIVVFILVMFTSQMIISAISTEKIDKTLETLLSVPVSRLSVLSAKMLAAAIVALINAAVYMIGFYGYMSSFLKGSLNSEVLGETLTIDDILSELGLKIGIGGYALVGIQMFLTILICLAVSLILGALVNDAKSAQTVLMPIMVFAMIPYLISMVYDVSMLSPVPKALIYAIPFTHTFSAINNIMFGRMDIFWIGLAYQAVLFVICMFFAVRLFMSDKIFTISLNLNQKRKLKKNK
ncbi:MAG: ABC transporter permease [Porcipelethomonas sp.]